MLRTLRIRNLVIVEDLTVEFGAGLNLVTGAPGAGKSILVEALALLAGGRADRSLVRSGATVAIVEALFEVAPGSDLPLLCRAAGLGDIEENQLVVQREISAAGSGRVLVNGSPCTLNVLRELGGRVLELHSQHQQQTLLVPENHLDLLDRFGGHLDAVARVGKAHGVVRAAADSCAALKAQADERNERLEVLERQVREVEALDPQPGELEALDRERRILQSAERMARLLDELVALSYEGEPAAADLAAMAAGKAAELAAIDPDLEDLAARFRSAAVELQDAGSAIRDYRDRRDFDALRLETVEARRVAVERLCLRHRTDEAGLAVVRENALAELATLRRLEDDLELRREELTAAERRYAEFAAALGQARCASAMKLVPAVQAQFEALALGQACFEVAWSLPRAPLVEPAGGEPVPLHPRGAERVEFLLAANPGEPLRPLAQVASGGELSRVMLALHVVAEDRDEGRVLVFDEVDAGVGGAVADAVGSRLSTLARRHQVLCVTHLPQVAVYGDEHFQVQKTVSGGRTATSMKRLSDTERIEEIARMLAGKSPTPTSREHAAALLAATGRGTAGRPVVLGRSRRRA